MSKKVNNAASKLYSPSLSHTFTTYKYSTGHKQLSVQRTSPSTLSSFSLRSPINMARGSNTQKRKRVASADPSTKTSKKSRTDKAASTEKTTARSGESQAASSQDQPEAPEPRRKGRKTTCHTEEEENQATAALKAAGVIVIDETSSSEGDEDAGSKRSSRQSSPEEDSEAELGV